MLRAHSLLWHYLWLAPEVLQLGLAALICRRGLHRLFPAFFFYAVYEAAESLTLYTLDILPSVSSKVWWEAFWVGLLIEGLVKIVLVRALLDRLLRSQPSLVGTGRRLFAVTTGALAFCAAIVAAYTTPTNPHWFVGGGLILQQTLYFVQCGLILFVFSYAAYFNLSWDRLTFGIALGFGIVFCQHFAAWAVEAGIVLRDHGVFLDFLNMGTYHLCVLIWCYYLLVPHKSAITSAVALPQNNLSAWNRELERLLQ